MSEPSFDAVLERKLDRARVRDNVVVCVFANRDYRMLLRHWLVTAAHAGCRKPIVFCLDREAKELCQEAGVEHHLFPFTGDRLGFWRHRVAILRKILDLGYSPLVSDIDAIWLRDPVPYIAGQPQDAIFSPGSIFPEEAHSVWGNVLCAGPCLLRPTPAVLTFLDQVWPHLRTQDDQAAINRQLLTLGLEFEPADLYPMPFRGRDVLQSRDTRTGTVGDLSVALLPNRLFQRLQEPGEPEPLVIHPVSPKVEDTKIAHFREIGLWFEDLMSEAAPR
ncbi:MAG: hypothetical protein KDJ72_03525 [Methyloceanibacter sp.]|uniref:putative nucleotide-diphospho-sugar transferase n=1 Tax=Methyloceanibacter sp. TaxID=1965321 RepID=UPI001DDF9068|nr:putative nucleotide-diphospho-sugar transferase [Methyloceanibacter sp.]MCB1442069.1 hypothetical protein [Methyloceanibacter sp.]